MAIIVVLAAVAMPTFAKQLETSRETADLETIRNAYVDAFTDAMKDVQATGAIKSGGAYAIENLTFKQQKEGFDYITGTVAGTSVTGNTISTHNMVTFTFALADDGGLSLSSIATSTKSTG